MASQDHTNAGQGYGNPYIDSLIWGRARWDVSAGPITYWFGSPLDLYDGDKQIYPNPHGSSSPAIWWEEEIAAFHVAIANYEAVTNLKFQESASIQSADMVWWKIAAGTLPNGGAEHEVPDGEGSEHNNFAFSAGVTDQNMHQIWGFFETVNMDGWGEFRLGSGAITDLLHELGHGMGLAHPHDGGREPDATLFPGLDEINDNGTPNDTSDDYISPYDLGDSKLNQGIFSVMSYNTPWTGEPAPDHMQYGNPTSLGAFDIAALQIMYGANNEYHTDDDTYVLPAVTGFGTGFLCIWDAGGNDTLSFEDETIDATIDLRAAPLTGPNAGGYVSWAHGVLGDYTIANNVIIENAKGGSGNDKISGNDFDNIIDGGDGDDNIFGYGGNDIIDAGWGRDTVRGGAGDDRIIIGTGGRIDNDMLVDGEMDDDILEVRTPFFLTANGAHIDTKWNFTFHTGSSGFGFLINETGGFYNGFERLDFHGGAQDDLITGGDNDDRIDGGSGNDFIAGAYGDDILFGADGNDIFNIGPGEGVDFINGGEGNDRITINISDIQNGRDFFMGDNEGGIFDVMSFIHVEMISITGSAGHDHFVGGDFIAAPGGFADVFFGGAGNDILDGAGGRDLLKGETGNDFLYLSLGGDNIDGGDGDDTLVVNLALIANFATIELDDESVITTLSDGTTITHVEHIVTINSAQATQALVAGGSSGADEFLGTDFVDHIEGAGGNDILAGGKGGDLLDGGAGLDTASYFEGADTGIVRLNGIGVTASLMDPHQNTGDALGDTYVSIENLTGSLGNDHLVGDDGDNVLRGEPQFVSQRIVDTGAGAPGGLSFDFSSPAPGPGLGSTSLQMGGYDWLEGLGGSDRLFGSFGNDKLDGGDGDDVLAGGMGNDKLSGGAGSDTASYEDSDVRVSVNLLYSKAQNTGAGYDTLSSIENLRGSRFNDILKGNGSANQIFGGGGNDMMYGFAGEDKLEGETGEDRLYGGDGNDDLKGGSGTDRLYGDAGIDLLYGGSERDFLYGGDGNDELNGDEGDDNLYGEYGDDILNGGAGFDRLYGGSGNDRLDSGGGGCFMYGGDGDDVYFAYAGGDRIIENLGEGHDLVFADMTYTLRENCEDLQLLGHASINGMGNSQNNMLNGNAGDNRLFGREGDDRLAGGSGIDFLYGGADDDVFVLQNLEADMDKIMDFVSGHDRIEISAALFDPALNSHLNDRQFVANGKGLASLNGDQSTRFIYNTSDGSLYFDANGSDAGQSVRIAQFYGAPELKVSDFYILA